MFGSQKKLIETLTAQIEVLQSQLEKLKEENEKLKEDLTAALKKGGEWEVYANKLESAKNHEIQQLKNRIEMLEKGIDTRESVVDRLNKELIEAKTELARANSARAKAEEEKEELVRRLGQIEELLKGLLPAAPLPVTDTGITEGTEATESRPAAPSSSFWVSASFK